MYKDLISLVLASTFVLNCDKTNFSDILLLGCLPFSLDFLHLTSHTDSKFPLANRKLPQQGRMKSLSKKLLQKKEMNETVNELYPEIIKKSPNSMERICFASNNSESSSLCTNEPSFYTSSNIDYCHWK